MVEFGPHLMLDGYDCDRANLDDEGLVRGILGELPGELGMKILGGPVVERYLGNGGHDPGGLSGFVMITDSHISIHTVPEKGFVSVDVYSCKEFDVERAKGYFKDKFGIGKMDVNLVKRGTHY
ncbi:MAG: adenosylmethionine decarboxylase [Candidatus Diapherotrites archaeon]